MDSASSFQPMQDPYKTAEDVAELRQLVWDLAYQLGEWASSCTYHGTTWLDGCKECAFSREPWDVLARVQPKHHPQHLDGSSDG